MALSSVGSRNPMIAIANTSGGIPRKTSVMRTRTKLRGSCNRYRVVISATWLRSTPIAENRKTLERQVRLIVGGLAPARLR